MRLVLKAFQEDAVKRLVRYMRGAAKDSRTGDLQAVSLSAVTGSGKTVMLTSAIETLLSGSDEEPPISEATFLWLTDQPELNEQTRKKMLGTSSLLDEERLVVIDATFNRETLRPGTVHFLNIQKLGKDKSLVVQGDKRQFTIWEIIKNTVESRRGRFFTIIDEAHRGMREGDDDSEAMTIVQKFIKGSSGEIPPMPIVVGVSATPERFNKLIVGTGRMNRPIDVDIDAIKASGLIKDTIVLHHPKAAQPTDMTLLREAARSYKEYTTQWQAYCAKHESFEFFPLLLVQVEDAGGKGQISETDIPHALSLLRAELGNLSNEAFAHSFQEGAPIEFGGETVRYLAPSDIQDDQDVRVVFFKTSLNTGWDCPRAEVMMSFRSATDATNIAQLVGRMVRTPLARRIKENEFLNTVALFLPHYDSAGLKRIVSKLSKPDDGRPEIEVREERDVEQLVRAPKTDAYFAALQELPSYFVPRKRKASQVRRLMKLARLLANDAIDDRAPRSAREKLLGILNSEFNRLKKSARFKSIVDDKAKIDIEAVNWDVGTDATYGENTVQVDIASENVDDLFEATGRKLNEGLHKIWWRERVKERGANPERAKLELFAICTEPAVIGKLEDGAQEMVGKWLSRYRSKISELDEQSRATYDEVQNLAAKPELVPLTYPTVIESSKGAASWAKHLYVNERGKYSQEFNGPETDVLTRETASSKAVAWLRNTDRKPWALCVPYEVDGEERAMYPDFLVIRKEGKGYVVDIVDPHTISLSDAAPKAAGLAKFAAMHANAFGRIELVMLDGTQQKRLDLAKETVRNKVKGIKLPEQLRQLFDEA
jgi:type III restriction enzyme